MAHAATSPAPPKAATGACVFADGTVIWGMGFGKAGYAVGEVCFNTSITGYQEIMTDPSYAAQIVTFTFPHIGNVGANMEDVESAVESAVGCIVREPVSLASNFRSTQEFAQWMEEVGKIGLSGVDTRALTRRIRLSGAPNAIIVHEPNGGFDIEGLLEKAREWSGLEGLDLAARVSREKAEKWDGGEWRLGQRYENQEQSPPPVRPEPVDGLPFTTSDLPKQKGRASTSSARTDILENPQSGRPHIVAIDYGSKNNIFRNLVRAGARVTVVPASTSLDEILTLNPDGVFLSNGPGDPAATGEHAVPIIRELLERDIPIFGICLGHQLLALAAGATTTKMHQGHRGANHPVQRVGEGWGDSAGLVEITSMNHGFTVDGETLPDSVEQTHASLFDGSNCGIAVKGKRAFGVQYHPEASPGPQDSFYLFEKFVRMLG